jgi:ubiquinone/menaquinone biosynthesis C-methylase UbiE
MSETPDKAGRALSFGAIAKQYDRYRPSPPRKALEWLLPERVTDALDLAAGTGALSWRLIARADRVIAVEPDERMRALLARRLPQVTALTGRAEALPLPDASVDAVLVSSAWHWVDPERAVPEIARVLRPGGTFGILWTGLDREDAAGLAAALWRASGELRSASARSAPHRPGDVRLPAGAPFATPEIARLRVTWPV